MSGLRILNLFHKLILKTSQATDSGRKSFYSEFLLLRMAFEISELAPKASERDAETRRYDNQEGRQLLLNKHIPRFCIHFFKNTFFPYRLSRFSNYGSLRYLAYIQCVTPKILEKKESNQWTPVGL